MKRIFTPTVYAINVYTSMITLVVFILFIIIVLPNETQKSEALGLISSPDTTLFYTADQLIAIALQYGDIGRQFYIKQRFTFDLIWPIVYGVFLFVNSVYLYQKNKITKYKYILVIPIVAVVFDYLENIMTSIVMYRYPNPTIILDHLAGFMTLFKWITLGTAFIIYICLLILLTINYQKKERLN